MNPGTKLGPYQITSQLGAGGMGEVYAATDTRLDRTVAIKVLPEHLASDPQRRERFEREAKAVSSLNHPHICTLYDVGEQDGTHYLVMELVEGETLESRLEKGRLPLDQALEYAIQIADALDKAHRQGVVHRDLKPGNIMLTKSGVKLLDFGLAKLKGDAAPTSGLSQAPTQDRSLTAEGTILGTLQYMAPEQLEGEEADSRTDIFAFGAVVYEMVTWKKAFEGKSQASLIGAIMNAEPQAMTELQVMTPRSLDRLVRQCLAKDADERWQTSGDLMRELRWVAEIGAESNIAIPAAVSGTFSWPLAVAVIILIAIVSGSSLWFFGLSEATPQEWSTILPPNSTSGVAPEPAVSPDGQSVVFRARNDAGQTTLWVRTFDSPTARELSGTQGASLPFWSPDSRAVGFFTFPSGELRRADLAGGAAQFLTNAANPRGGDWNQNGVILFAPTPGSGLYTILASGGEALQVTTPEAGVNHRNPHFLPDGQHFLFHESDNAGRAELYVGSLESAVVQRVENISSRVEYANGHLFYGDGDALYAQEFDTETFEASGGRRRVAEAVGVSFGWLGNHAFSVTDQRLVYANGGFYPETQFVVLDREGRSLGSIGTAGETYGFDLAPSGLRVAFEQRDSVANTVNVSLMNLATGLPTLFTSGSAWTGVPVWSPDGERVLYTDFNNTYFIKDVRNEEVVQEVEVSFGSGGWPIDWSADGRYVSVEENDADTKYDVWIVALAGAEPPVQFLGSRANEFEARFSPNVDWIAYASDENERYEIYVQSFPDGGNKQRISTDGGRRPMWRNDGQELYYINSDQELIAATIAPTPSGLEVSTRSPLFEVPELIVEERLQYAVLDSGDRFIFNAVYEGAEPRSITVVKNWEALMEETP